MIKEIQEAIWELECLGCRDENLIIAFSPLVERFLEREIYEMRVFPSPNIKLEKLQGIKTYNLHPYNEIVVYDSLHSCHFPEMIRKIEVNKPKTHDLP